MAKTETLRAIALNIALSFILLNIGIRPPFGTDYIYYVGNLYCLVIVALIPMFQTKGFERYLSIGVLLTMIHNFIDGIYYNLAIPETNEAIAIPIICSVVIIGYYRNRAGLKWERSTMALLAIIPLKLATANTTAMIGDKYLLAIGDATVYLLISCFVFLKNYQVTQVIPVLLFAAALNNFLDNTAGDPYKYHGSELFVMLLVIINLIWWELRKKFAIDQPSKVLYRHIFIALQILIFGGGIILLLRYN